MLAVLLDGDIRNSVGTVKPYPGPLVRNSIVIHSQMINK